MSKKFRLGTIKVLGGIGYISILFQWLQIGVAWLPGLFDSRLGKAIFPQSHTALRSSQPITVSGVSAVGPDFVTTFLVTALALVLIGFVMYVVFIRYTKAVSKTSSQVTHVVAKRVVHIIARKPLDQVPAKKRAILNRRFLFWTKLVFAVLPFALLPVALHDGQRGIVEQLAIFAQAILATVAVLSFFAQAVLAARWHEHTDDID